MTSDVIVIGAINIDLISTVERRPLGGQTILATGYSQLSGGKGANQAAAAARAGARVALVGAIGSDGGGAAQLELLQASGVDTEHVALRPGPTGVATIFVTPDGENSIVVAQGANALIDVAQVEAAMATAAPGAVVVLQTEVDTALLDAAARLASGRGLRLIVNNGPYRHLADATNAAADPVIVNQHEARDACGPGAETVDLTELAVHTRRALGARSVIVTLGGDGALIASDAGNLSVPAAPVTRVVDTTGAGDTFVGTLAADLARKLPLADAAVQAAAAAADAVTWPGARPPVSPLP